MRDISAHVYDAVALEIAYQLKRTSEIEGQQAIERMAYNLAITFRNLDPKGQTFDETEFVETALRDFAEEEMDNPDKYIDDMLIAVERSIEYTRQ